MRALCAGKITHGEYGEIEKWWRPGDNGEGVEVTIYRFDGAEEFRDVYPFEERKAQ